MKPRVPAVFPAVDVLEGEVVRLERGDFDRVTTRAGDPVDVVRRLARSHPPLLHVVDLAGARRGGIRVELVRRLAVAADGVPLQVSGGVRSPADALALVGAGAERVVIGTAAFAAPDAIER
ncbi:MAG: HisA/HisF-related TIM barrel protein, partial [Actinomycetota bacterium]|nr:HisA/HisF-related TIM barrel protein [Actinomycetota bacterium]